MCCATGESQCFPQGRNANLHWALHFGPGRDQFHDDLHLDLEKNPRTWPEDPQISRNVEEIYSFFEQILWKPWILQDFYVELGRCQALIRVTLTCGPMLARPHVICLDEPTNYLGTRWHEQLISIHWLNMAKP